jgi:hypothetical protein
MKNDQVLTLIINKTCYLPAIPSPMPIEWADVPAQDFANPDLWEQIGQLKNKFAITSERSFRRTIARLKSLGLRTLPAQQDARLRLCYRPDAERLATMIAKQSVQNVVTPSNPNQQPTITQNQLAEIWQAISELQSQQRTILAAINNLRTVPT